MIFLEESNHLNPIFEIETSHSITLASYDIDTIFIMPIRLFLLKRQHKDFQIQKWNQSAKPLDHFSQKLSLHPPDSLSTASSPSSYSLLSYSNQ